MNQAQTKTNIEGRVSISLAELTSPEFDRAVIESIARMPDGSVSSAIVESLPLLLPMYERSDPWQGLLRDLMRVIDEDVLSSGEKVEFIFRLGFLSGWHSRAIVEQTRSRTI